jgi:hypothetical protein
MELYYSMEIRIKILPFADNYPKNDCYILLFCGDGKIRHANYSSSKFNSGSVTVHTENSFKCFKWEFLTRDGNHMLGWNYYKGEIVNAQVSEH